MTDERIERLMSVHGGICPSCGRELRISEIGGTREFLCEYSVTDGPDEVNVWNDSPDPDEIGCWTFVHDGPVDGCDVEQFDTWCLSSGDWDMSENLR